MVTAEPAHSARPSSARSLVGAPHHAVAHEHEAERFAYRDHGRVKLEGPIDLTDERRHQFFAGVPALWASIHVAGGFAMSPVAKTGKAAIDASYRNEFS